MKHPKNDSAEVCGINMRKHLDIFFQGQLLVASPFMTEDFFCKTVVYVCEHSQMGAFGFVINKPLNTKLEDLLLCISKQDRKLFSNHSLHKLAILGGPVGKSSGFLLYESLDGIKISSSKDKLMSMVVDNPTRKFLLALGYSCWESGQLEEEVMRNDWIVVPSKKELIFGDSFDSRWSGAAASAGIDINRLVRMCGHA